MLIGDDVGGLVPSFIRKSDGNTLSRKFETQLFVFRMKSPLDDRSVQNNSRTDEPVLYEGR